MYYTPPPRDPNAPPVRVNLLSDTQTRPTGTMCNVASTLVHCRPGDEILAHETAHIISREGGAHAALGGFQITQLKGPDGQFTPETFRKALHPRSRYQPPQTLVSVEQTANIGGGTIWKKAALDEIVAIASSTASSPTWTAR